MSDVSVFMAALFVEEIARYGQSPEDLLQGTSLSPDQVRGARRGRCSWHDFATVIENGTDRLGGLDQIEQVGRGVTHRPPAVLAALARRFSLMHTLYYIGATWYGPLHFRGARGYHTDLPDGVIQSIHYPSSYRASVPVYHAMKGVLAAGPRMIGWQEAGVEMSYQDHEVAYRVHLKAPDAERAFDPWSIEQERSEADAYITEFAAIIPTEGEADSRGNGPGKGAPVSQRVRWLIEAGPDGPDLGVRRAARRLGMSERSLARGLARESTTFSELRDSVRARQAVARLVRGERIEDVATSLGFADASSFHRAFRRWTGRSPGSFRPGSS